MWLRRARLSLCPMLDQCWEQRARKPGILGPRMGRCAAGQQVADDTVLGRPRAKLRSFPAVSFGLA